MADDKEIIEFRGLYSQGPAEKKKWSMKFEVHWPESGETSDFQVQLPKEPSGDWSPALSWSLKRLAKMLRTVADEAESIAND